jgi:NAD(P)-dependent dehydrogenase (short-subunit alcohol dehydrogenase family)
MPCERRRERPAQMNQRLGDVRAIVTGAGRGIGRAIAVAFASEGASVVAAARSRPDLDAVVGEIRGAGGTAAAVPTDITRDADVEHLVVEATRALDGPATVLVNNAALYRPRAFLDYSMQDWQQHLEVNVLGTVRVTRAFLPGMLAARAGRVINVASTAAKWGTANQSAYNVSKHGMLGLTRCLALEVARQGVRVTAICPGWVDTQLIDEAAADHAALLGIPEPDVRGTLAARAPIGRMATPEEVAALAVYLASPEADAITGVGLTIAGGLILD